MSSRNKGTIPWKIWVPAELALRIESRYCDEVTGKPDYGIRSHLIVALLQEFDKATMQHETTNPGFIRRLVERIASEEAATQPATQPAQKETK